MSAFFIQPMNIMWSSWIVSESTWVCAEASGVPMWCSGKKAFLTITSDLPVIYTAFLKHAHSLTHISYTTPHTSLGSRGAKRPSENINNAMWADNRFLPCVYCLYPLHTAFTGAVNSLVYQTLQKIIDGTREKMLWHIV